MNSTFFRQKSHIGFSRPAYHKSKNARHFGFVGYATNDMPTSIDTSGDVPYTDPKYEIDFYAMPCEKLAFVINDLQSFMESARLTQTSFAYYSSKMAQMKTAYATMCGDRKSVV